MNLTGTGRGVEARKLNAAQPEWKLVRLTSSDTLESQHTYYDICPWSHDGRYITFSSAPLDADWNSFGHDSLACPTGRINVLDTRSMDIQEVSGQATYARHGGAFCMWHPKRHTIFYRQDEQHFAALDIATGEKRLLPGIIRQVSPDGESFAVLLQSPHKGGQGAAVGALSADGTDLRELVNREQLHALTPNRDLFRADEMRLGNTKWHPGGEHILIAMWVYPHPEARRSLYIVSRDGSEARWLTHFAHHHSWTPDGQAVLFNDRLPDKGEADGEPRMFLVDFDGTNRRVLFDRPVGSHPLMHPGGDSVIDADTQGIYLVQLEENRVQRLVDFSGPFDRTHHGTHPHPVWNQTGDGILYNSAETGHSEVYLLTRQ